MARKRAGRGFELRLGPTILDGVRDSYADDPLLIASSYTSAQGNIQKLKP